MDRSRYSFSSNCLEFFRRFIVSGSFGSVIFVLLLLSAPIVCDAFYVSRSEITRPGSGYHWGEAKSDDRDEARERARAELASNISVTVSSEFEHRWKEENANYEDFMESVVTTYTSASFSNLQPLIDRDSQGNYVFLFFISEEDLQEEFARRKEEIIYIYETAKQAEQSTNLSRALQYYYYAVILMNSVPERFIEYRDKNLVIEIPLRIRNILSNVEFIYEGDVRPSESLRTVILRLEYEGRPVQELDFIYLERGSEHTAVARDGRVTCDLTGASVSYDNLDIEIEYRFASERDCVPLVAELWNGVHRPSYNNRRTISFEKPPAAPEPTAEELQPLVTSDKFNIFLTNRIDCPVSPQIKSESLRFLEALSTGDIELIRDTFADDPFLADKIAAVMNYNNPRLVDETFNVEINKIWSGWEMRSIPVACNYPSIRRQTMEYLILDFDEEGKLVDIGFNVFDELHQNYVNRDDITDKERLQRQTIIKFLEKYRTAFLNRDLDTIEKIFAEEAVVIVGRVLQPGSTDREYSMERDLDEIEYIQMTKEQYLQRQRRIFNAQRDIHLGFNTFNLQKKDIDSDVFGISMRQQYASSGYADEGYLFLLIDFLEEDPLIYVRSWQPGEWTRDQMIKMSDFDVLE